MKTIHAVGSREFIDARDAKLKELEQKLTPDAIATLEVVLGF